MIAIVPLAPHHCEGVAQLHLDYLQTSFRGRPGLGLLQTYYAALANSVGACGFVAEEGELIVGYVCGVWEPAAVRITLLKGDWPVLAFWGMAQVLARPQMLGDFVKRLRKPLRESASSTCGYELRPIVVAPEARGCGIGTQLVEVLLADAARRGFDGVYLFVEHDNDIANAFYRKIGFRLSGQKIEPKAVHLRYEYSFSGL